MARSDEVYEDDAEFTPHRDTNTVVFTGRLTEDPEKRGKTTTFGFAVHSVDSVEDEPVEVPNYINRVVTFGRDAKNVLEYLESGREVEIVGSLRIEKYELEIDGENIYWDEECERPVKIPYVEVLVDRIQFRR